MALKQAPEAHQAVFINQSSFRTGAGIFSCVYVCVFVYI